MTWPLEWEQAPQAQDRRRLGRVLNVPRTSTLTALHQRGTAAAPRAGARNGRGFTVSRPQAAADGKTTVELSIYDEIGWWGTTAADFKAALDEVDADAIDLRLSSPGGDAFDGIAIYNALIDHPAVVTVYVDAIALSAASVIAQAGDRVVMGPHSEMMIHDAWGVSAGNADDMREMAELLDRVSLSIAEVYSSRTGRGTPEDWRETMKGEQWYSADEAVAAGLADEAVKRGKRSGAGADDNAAKAEFDLSMFRFQSRAAAPAPAISQPVARKGAGTAPGGGPAAEGPGGGAPGGEPTTGTPAPAPATEPDPWADLADDVFAGLAGTVTTSVAEAAEDPFPWDAEAFVAVVAHEANNAPAPTAQEPPATTSEAPSWRDFTNALQEALT
jgi:ATP-dependent protease ClpP protease subunit